MIVSHSHALDQSLHIVINVVQYFFARFILLFCENWSMKRSVKFRAKGIFVFTHETIKIHLKDELQVSEGLFIRFGLLTLVGKGWSFELEKIFPVHLKFICHSVFIILI